MARKRRQERIATSRLALPLTSLYGAVVALVAGTLQQGLWLQAACLFIATEMIAMLNNRYSLTRVYSRMLSCTYLMLSAAVCFRDTSMSESIVAVCIIAFYFIIFQAYQNRRGAGPVFYAFAMIGIASIFFVKILYFVPFLWIILAAYILAFSFRTFMASILGLLFPYWFVAGYYVYNHNLPSLLSHFNELAVFGDISNYQHVTEHQAVTFIFIAFLGLTGIIHFLRNSYKDKIKIRMFYETFITLHVATMLFIILQPQHYDFLIHIMIVTTAVLFGHFLALTRTWLTNIVFHLVIVLILLLTAYNLWMPSLLF